MNIVTLKGTMKKGGAGETFVRHIDKPALYTTTIFKEILQKNGVEINGKLMPKESLDTCNLLYSHFSEPLIHLVYDMNKGSLNFYADQLIKTIGAEMQGTPGSFEKGIAEVEKFLKTLGLNEEEFRIYDGSGLSRYNLISAHGIVKILLKALELDIKAEFLTSLPIAGVDGTLKGRLKSSNTIGKVRAKTGTMMNTSSLSGYTTTSQKTPVVFSIIINNYTCPPQVIKELQDKIIELIISEI
jgi:PBP4 family serine-type D-alanyl-D-alanine carboxypeptidase